MDAAAAVVAVAAVVVVVVVVAFMRVSAQWILAICLSDSFPHFICAFFLSVIVAVCLPFLQSILD